MSQAARLTGILLTLAFLMGGGGPVLAGSSPSWWSQVQKLAQEGGYRLITPDELQSLFDNREDFLLLDARPAYEFDEGRLPGAVNYEFHPGDRAGLSPDRLAAFEGVLGPDRDRRIVIYCRNFR